MTQLEIMPKPPEHENKPLTWPNWPLKLRTSSSQEEGAEREFSVSTTRLRRRGRQGEEAALRAGRRQDAAGARAREFELKADLVLLAMGFVGPGRRTACSRSSALDARPARQRRAPTPTSATIATRPPKVFAAGDMRRGQSLVVWAIREGRQARASIDKFLMGATTLPR